MSLRRTGFALGAVAFIAVVAACGGTSSGSAGAPRSPGPTQPVVVTETPTPPTSHTTPPTTTPAPTPSTAPHAAGCTTGQLKLTLGAGQGTAGSTYQPIILTNTSSGPCSLTGYPGVSFVDSAGAQLGKPAARTHQPYQSVTLAAGGQASALLRLPDPGVFSPSDCNQTTASRLKVYPPNQLGALLVADTADICTTKVGRASIGPMHSGTDG